MYNKRNIKEQKESKKSSTIKLPDYVPYTRTTVIKPANNTAKTIAQQHGASLDGWSAFTIINRATRKPTFGGPLVTEPQIIDALNQTDKTSKKTYYGNDSFWDKLKDDVPQYMYIVGPDVSKRKRVFKYNVWICNYHQLYMLSKQLYETEPITYSEVIEDVPTNRYENIIIITAVNANKWFSGLRKALQQEKLNPKPEGSRVLIPDLQYLDKDYDSSDTAFEPYTIDVTDAKASEMEYDGSFRGFARIQLDEFGNTEMVALSGRIGVVDRDTEIPGVFEGEFKNGAPYEGVITYDDGDVYRGILQNVISYIGTDGEKRFSYQAPKSGTDVSVGSVKWDSNEGIIRVVQQDISDMLKNNPDWVNSFNTPETQDYYTALQYFVSPSFQPDGIWDENMRTATLLLNVITHGDDVLDPNDTTKFRLGARTEITKETRDNIIKYKTDKIQ